MKAYSVLFNLIPILIMMGAVIMGLSIVKTNNILKLLKFNEAIKSWKILFYLMIFFLFGYSVAFYLFIYKIIDLIAVLTGLVFFLGSCFVLLSVNIYHQTLEKILKIQEEYREAKETVETTLAELKRTQTQLIHNEKMLSLGQLVAGVAHEINNPVNFISGNLNHLDNDIQTLLFFIQIYQQEFPDATPTIQKAMADNELEFIIEDLPKIVSSMKVGTGRIAEIVRSLRTFSRMDEADVKSIDIHESIDSTLMILEHRLQNKLKHPKIQVIKEYSNIPLVQCYAGQINQVFMNIITNSIDALEEKNSDRSYKEIINYPSTITISTSINSHKQLQIFITDNGTGISESVKNRIFDPFYTTKAVGKGTGLGLSISYEIIKKHRGTLDCISTPGEGTQFIIQIPFYI